MYLQVLQSPGYCSAYKRILQFPASTWFAPVTCYFCVCAFKLWPKVSKIFLKTEIRVKSLETGLWRFLWCSRYDTGEKEHIEWVAEKHSCSVLISSLCCEPSFHSQENWNSDNCSTHESCMDQPYPCSSVSHVEMAQRWLLGVCISNWLCTIPLTPPPLPLPTSILSGCVYLSVGCVRVFKCTVSVSARTQGGLLLVYMIGSLSLSASNSLQSHIYLLCPSSPAQGDHLHTFTKS